jgi:hypothetical protein
MLTTIPISWYQATRYYYKKPYDINCIKKARFFLSGKLQAKLALPISLPKSKVLAKSMGITFNDLVLGLLSKSLKSYFVAHGDDSTYISLAMPFSFNTIPENMKDY